MKRKYIWITTVFCVFAILTGAFLLFDRQYSRMGYLTSTHPYLNYVSSEYFPEWRLERQKWPEDLGQLTKTIQEERQDSSEPGRREALRQIMEFHNEDFLGLEMLHVTTNKCSYILHLKGADVTCESSINPNNGTCAY